MNLVSLARPLPAPMADHGAHQIPKARMADIPQLLALINGYAAQGLMLARSEFEMAENIRDFTVAEEGAAILGCGALHFYASGGAEVRALAVHPAAQNHGLGRLLVEALEEEARGFGVPTLFAFTYVPRFFSKLGYREVERGELALKAWRDCLRCLKFQCCDKIAMIKPL
jgi:amino-acid N-acetyltransferase